LQKDPKKSCKGNSLGKEPTKKAYQNNNPKYIKHLKIGMAKSLKKSLAKSRVKTLSEYQIIFCQNSWKKDCKKTSTSMAK